MTEHEQLSQDIVNKKDEVIALYEEITKNGNLLGGLLSLSLSEKDAIKCEVRKEKKL